MKNVRKAMGLLALLVWLLTGCVGLAVDVIRAAPTTIRLPPIRFRL